VEVAELGERFFQMVAQQGHGAHLLERMPGTDRQMQKVRVAELIWIGVGGTMTGCRLRSSIAEIAARRGPAMSTVDPIHAIAAKRWAFALTLSALMLAIYLGFILLVAFGKPLLSILLSQGLSLGILLGALTIVSCWVLAIVYVLWANRGYDEAVARAIAAATAGSGRKS
jgi:uncharacterized membrane protein (DUF485 family)